MRRSVKYGSFMTVYAVLVFMSLALVNAISQGHYRKFDMTEEGIFTLSPQSEKIVRALSEKVDIYAFVKPQERIKTAEFLDKYEYASDMVSYTVVDPDKKPAMTRKYNVTDYGAIVVETASGRREAAKKLTEDEVTGAILKATTSRQKKIVVLTGHDERGIEDEKPMGWSGARQALESQMYRVETLNWFETGGVPEDADLLIVPGPRKDFQPGEVERLVEYAEKGRKLLIALDPVFLPVLEKAFEKYGVTFGGDMILDPLSQSLGFDPLVAAVASYEGHPVVKDFTAATFYPVARSLLIDEGNERNAKLEVIAKTTTQSWGETDIKSIENAEPVFSERDDLPGPRVVAVSVQWETGPPRERRAIGEKPEKAKMIVVGDSDFASNSTINFSGNRDLLLNMAAWLMEDEALVSIRPETRGFNPIFFTSLQLSVIFWVAVVAIPAAVGAAGVYVRARRRRG